MKISIPAIVTLAGFTVLDAFTIHQGINLSTRTYGSSVFINRLHNKYSSTTATTTLTQLKMSSDFGSDFGSAMPEKPELSFQEQMAESATTFMADIENRLVEGVPPPPELEDLRKARDNNADAGELALKIYILLIEQGMLYDSDPDTGKLKYTDFDIKNNLDIPEVKQEFEYLYKYGMGLIYKGVVDVDAIKEVVKERLIKRTGLSPEEFDKWLGY
jgi:hypothetical protein